MLFLRIYTNFICEPVLIFFVKLCPAPPLLLLLLCHAKATRPWILERGGLESPGQRLISLNGKTKQIAYNVYKEFFVLNLTFF